MSVVRTFDGISDKQYVDPTNDNYQAGDYNFVGPWGLPVYTHAEGADFPFGVNVVEGGACGWWNFTGTSFGDATVYFQEAGVDSHLYWKSNDPNDELQYRYGPSSEITHPSHTFTHNRWYWFETEWKIDDSNGYWRLWMREERTEKLLIDVSGVDTRRGGSGYVNRMSISSGISNSWMRDFVVWTKDGSGLTARPEGVLRLLDVNPVSDEEVSGFTSTAATHYEVVDELWNADDDTTHTYAASLGDRLRLGVSPNLLDDLLLPGDISPEIVACIARAGVADSASTSDFDLGIRELTNNAEDVTTHSLTTTYREKEHISELNPDTGLAWTAADFAAGVDLVVEQQ